MTSPLQALKDSLEDLHKPFSGMLDGWYEGIDYVPQPDTRTDEEIAQEQADEEFATKHPEA